MARDGFCYMGFNPPVKWINESEFNALPEWQSPKEGIPVHWGWWRDELKDGYLIIGRHVQQNPRFIGIEYIRVIIVKGK